MVLGAMLGLGANHICAFLLFAFRVLFAWRQHLSSSVLGKETSSPCPVGLSMEVAVTMHVLLPHRLGSPNHLHSWRSFPSFNSHRLSPSSQDRLPQASARIASMSASSPRGKGTTRRPWGCLRFPSTETVLVCLITDVPPLGGSYSVQPRSTESGSLGTSHLSPALCQWGTISLNAEGEFYCQ